MQVNSQVQVKNEKSEHFKRAGVIQSYDPKTEINVVKLDASAEQQSDTVEFDDTELSLLAV
ncbi:MAG: hypothetical protein ACXWJD_03985 [Burkholderiaceae bacterium]